MKIKNKKVKLIYPFALVQTQTYAGIRCEPEPTDEDDSGVPDWVAYLMLMFVLLIIFGKTK